MPKSKVYEGTFDPVTEILRYKDGVNSCEAYELLELLYAADDVIQQVRVTVEILEGVDVDA